MRLNFKNLFKDAALVLISSILIGLYVRNKDIKICCFISDKNGLKKEITLEEYRKLEYVPSDNKSIYFLSKEPVHLNKKAFIYGGAYFFVLMFIIFTMELKKSKL